MDEEGRTPLVGDMIYAKRGKQDNYHRITHVGACYVSTISGHRFSRAKIVWSGRQKLWLERGQKGPLGDLDRS